MTRATSTRAHLVGIAVGMLAFGVPAGADIQAQRLPVWQLTPEVRIGQGGSSSDHDFTRILAVLPAADGSVVIVDVANNEIGVFSRAGAFLRNVGRRGRGPAEFIRIRSAGVLGDGDTLWKRSFAHAPRRIEKHGPTASSMPPRPGSRGLGIYDVPTVIRLRIDRS